MFRLQRFEQDALAAYLARQAELPFPYAEVGATHPLEGEAEAALASRYRIDRKRILIGRGRHSFERARTALFAWRHFEIDWLELLGASAPVHEGQCVATLVRSFGLWAINPCRVVYVLDDPAAPDLAGFAYGTLPDHVARGEEHFLLRFDPPSEEVHFEILAFSRAHHVLAKLALPYLRGLQRRFAPAAVAALRQALREA